MVPPHPNTGGPIWRAALLRRKASGCQLPYGTLLLCVSDKPLRGEIKLPAANGFYERAVAQHLEIHLTALDLLRERRETPHSHKLRSFDEPPFR
jgi:AMP nucleosidase